MSLLNWITTPGQVVVYADTLAVLADRSGTPVAFSAKVMHYPHLGVIVGGTGYMDLIHRWLLCVTSAPAEGVDDLADHAERLLPHIMSGVLADGVDQDSAIRHWGWSERSGCFVGHTFRSEDGFRREVMTTDSYGMHPAPSPEWQEANADKAFETEQDIIDLIHDQQAFGASDRATVRCHVGGRLLRYSMYRTDDGTVMCEAGAIGALPAFDEHSAAIAKRRAPGDA